MSFEQMINGHDEAERGGVMSTNTDPDRDIDDRNITTPSSENATKKKKKREQLLSFRSATRKIERRRLVVEKEELWTVQEKLERLMIYEGGSSITPARMEELKEQAKRDARNSHQLDYYCLRADFKQFYLLFEVRELKQMTQSMWDHRILDGFRTWANDRIHGKGKLRRRYNGAKWKCIDIRRKRLRATLSRHRNWNE